jgi:hypothetical protein
MHRSKLPLTVWFWAAHLMATPRNRLRIRANLRSRSRSAVGGYAGSVKAEPVEEHKDSGIILDLTRCRQRLNNRAAILQSKIT